MGEKTRIKLLFTNHTYYMYARNNYNNGYNILHIYFRTNIATAFRNMAASGITFVVLVHSFSQDYLFIINFYLRAELYLLRELIILGR